MTLPLTNPFTIPGDEQVFVLREQEKWQKEEERRKAQHRSVKDKLTWSSRIGSAREGVATHSLGSSAAKTWTAGAQASQREGTQGETAVAKEKENMNEFIAKKREMGLIRMSMATKLHEIRKLEEEAERAEKRVKQQEEQLEETVQKFEDFLKDNDMRAVEAMKKAELETKGKQEKTAEIKKLSAQIAAIQNEKMKYEEQMQACIRYKKFLDKLTPAGWFRETLCNIELQRLRQELERDVERRFAIREAAEDIDTAQLAVDKAAAQAELESQIEDTRGTLMARLEDQLDEAVAAELNVMDPDIVSMFFVDPEKILNIFMEIEENNLFLIQNCQETEEGLEELKSKFAETKTKMDEDAANLKSQIEQVRQKMGVEETKKKQLLARMASTKDGKSQEDLLNHIHAKVTEIFKNSGFGDNEANINTLGMLTKIETKLEELRTAISSLPTSFVWEHMKARDKDRRQRARQHLLEKERIKREKRSATALARSQAPVKKMVGKPVMWRSRPIDRKQAEVVSEDNENEFDDSEFFQ